MAPGRGPVPLPVPVPVPAPGTGGTGTWADTGAGRFDVALLFDIVCATCIATISTQVAGGIGVAGLIFARGTGFLRYDKIWFVIPGALRTFKVKEYKPIAILFRWLVTQIAEVVTLYACAAIPAIPFRTTVSRFVTFLTVNQNGAFRTPPRCIAER